MVQTSYSNSLPSGSVGMIASPDRAVVRCRNYPEVDHEVHVNVGGTTDGTYSFRITDDEGETYLVEFEASGDSEDDIVTGLANAANSASSAPNLRNILIATANTSDDDVELVAVHKGRPFTVTLVSNPGTNMAATTVTNADRSALPIGVAMARSSTQGDAQPPDSSTVEAEIEGILALSPGLEGPLDGGELTVPVGYELNVLEQGDIWVMPEEDVTHTDDVYVRVAASGSEVLGALRASADGGTQVATITPVADHLQYSIKFGYLGRDYEFHYAPTDGTTTVADAVDGLEDAAAAIAPDGVTVSDASGSTMTLTAAAGTEFDYVESTAFSLDTEAASASVSLASADVDAIKMTRWRWLSAGGPTSGSPAKLHVSK